MRPFILAWVPRALAWHFPPASARAADDPATDRPAGEIGAVAAFDDAMPTGATVSRRGRIVVYPHP